MKRILFVDDEPNVLAGLRRTLRSMRKQWEMEFASSGAEALEACDAQPFDVVVLDMKMPGMNGAELMSRLVESHSGTLRVVLSGQTEREVLLRSFGLAHQWLPKPCDPSLLRETIDRAEACRAFVGERSLEGVIGETHGLPCLPKLFREVQQELRKPDCSLKTIGEIVSRDVGMSSKILRIVNSAYFGLKHPMTDAQRAVAFVGLDVVKSLVLGLDVFSQYDDISATGLAVDALWEHSLRTSVLASHIAKELGLEPELVDDARTAGMLHDAGKLVLAANDPERYGDVVRRVREDGVPVSRSETEILGAHHAEVGAFLIALWGLPPSIVEAIAHHPEPSNCLDKVVRPLTAVYLANAFDNGMAEDALDPEYLSALELEGAVPSLWESCNEKVGEEVEA